MPLGPQIALVHQPASPACADSLVVSTGRPDGLMAMASRPWRWWQDRDRGSRRFYSHPTDVDNCRHSYRNTFWQRCHGLGHSKRYHRVLPRVSQRLGVSTQRQRSDAREFPFRRGLQFAQQRHGRSEVYRRRSLQHFHSEQFRAERHKQKAQPADLARGSGYRPGSRLYFLDLARSSSRRSLLFRSASSTERWRIHVALCTQTNCQRHSAHTRFASLDPERGTRPRLASRRHRYCWWQPCPNLQRVIFSGRGHGHSRAFFFIVARGWIAGHYPVAA